MNNKLRAAREKAGMTQAQVAEKAGIAEAVYQRYEYNTNRPGVDAAIRIADALGGTVEDLFSGAPERPTGRRGSRGTR